MAIRGSRWAVLAAILSLLHGAASMAGEQIPESPEPSPKYRYEEAVPRPHTTMESLRYLGILYVLSTSGYLYISRHEVFNNASFHNYVQNFFNIAIFDQDLPTSNWGVHLITGAVTYEFYRARSYSKQDAFFLTLAQECLFQFTVETLIVPIAMENVVNTAVVGTIIGRGLELASLPMLNSDFFLFRFFGYLFNLPAMIGLHENKVAVVPLVGSGKTGAALQMRF